MNDRTGLRWWKANIDTALHWQCGAQGMLLLSSCVVFHDCTVQQGLQTSAAWPQWLVTIPSTIGGSNSDLTISALIPASRSRYQCHSDLVTLYNCTSTSNEEWQTDKCNHFHSPNTGSSWPRCVLQLRWWLLILDHWRNICTAQTTDETCHH